VIVVDDHREMRRALSSLIEHQSRLRLAGVASDLESGLELARRARPDVALVDFEMPGGGPRLVRELGARYPGVRTIALSVHPDRGAVFEMLRAGAVGYIVKGEEAATIVQAIEAAASGGATLSTAVTADVLRELALHLDERGEAEDEQRRRLARVRHAIDSQAISCLYQPIVELASGRPVGYEALARIELEPLQGPSDWFADAAAVGHELEFERTALDAALRAFPRLPRGSFLSVNLGPAALGDEEILQVLAQTNPARTVVELTEHASVDDYDELARMLRQLRDSGVRFAVDDAGAGYASLRHVVRLAPDVIKIDGSITRRVETDSAARAMISALVSFARELAQLVVAEAVEDAREADVLRSLGVDYGQGYFFGRPQAL
jgi:EAL domain-containing protein (putative c-di-GMP-specific phosphodiesterase class I)/DNA-binding NarL/FixJ family response regulator